MSNRVAVVTGGNRGIGLQVCRELTQKGVTVILTARDSAKGEAAVAQLAAEGLEVYFHPVDVTQAESIQALVSYVQSTFSRLDILVNNAGVFLDRGVSSLDLDLETLKTTIETNVYGPLQLCQAVIPLMQQQNYGRVVNVSSNMGQLSTMGSPSLAYRTSKTALNAITAILADEMKGSNILINTMSPGWVRTDMGGSSAERSVEQGADTVVWLALLSDGGPSGGFFHEREITPW